MQQSIWAIAAHPQESISGDTSEYLKSSVVKPLFVHATKYSSVSILFLLRPTARKVLQPAAKTRVMAAIWDVTLAFLSALIIPDIYFPGLCTSKGI